MNALLKKKMEGKGGIRHRGIVPRHIVRWGEGSKLTDRRYYVGGGGRTLNRRGNRKAHLQLRKDNLRANRSLSDRREQWLDDAQGTLGNRKIVTKRAVLGGIQSDAPGTVAHTQPWEER